MDEVKEIFPFLQKNFPKHMETLENILGDYEKEIESLKKDIDKNLNSLAEQRRYDKLAEYANVSKRLSLDIDKLKMLVSVNKIHFDNNTTKIFNDKQRVEKHETPDYENYSTNPEVEYPLDNEWTNRRPCKVCFRWAEANVKTWKDIFLFVCSQLYHNFLSRFEVVVLSLKFNGRTPYFAKDPKKLRTAELIQGSSIYAEVNQSAETFKKILLCLLNTFAIDEKQLHVYIRRDYSPLHKK